MTRPYEDVRTELLEDSAVRAEYEALGGGMIQRAIPRIIHISAEERAGLECLAKGRNAPKERAGVTSRKIIAKRDDLAIHVEGLIAEYAVAKALGIGIDISLSLRGDGRTHDLTLRDGRTIQVKYRTRRGWDFALYGDDLSEFRADAGVLCWPGGQENTIEIIGCISRQRFAKVATVTDYGYGPRLMAGADAFVPLERMFIGEQA